MTSSRCETSEEQLVGGAVAETDRHIGKMVQVDRQNGCGPSVAWRAHQRGPDAVDEELSIGKAGQRVVERVKREALFSGTLFGDVTPDDDRAKHGAFRVGQPLTVGNHPASLPRPGRHHHLHALHRFATQGSLHRRLVGSDRCAVRLREIVVGGDELRQNTRGIEACEGLHRVIDEDDIAEWIADHDEIAHIAERRADKSLLALQHVCCDLWNVDDPNH